MRLIYMGSPQVSIYPLEHIMKNRDKSGDEVIAVVSQLAKASGRGLRAQLTPLAEFAQKSGLPVLEPEKASAPQFLETLRSLAPDVIITCAYGQILSSDFLSVPKRATINIHPSLLPKYRGATPVQAALLDGLKETGVSILFTVKALDAGNIILQKTFPIEANETAGVLMARLFTLSGPMLATALSLLSDKAFVGQEQDEKAVTLCKKISKDDGAIDWQASTQTVLNRFRAYHPWPGSFTYFRNKRMIIASMEPVNAQGSLPQGPGAWLFSKGEQAIIAATSDGAVKIKAVKPEGSKELATPSFWNGLRDKSGLVFSREITL
jgi:methionyl-tRNA formyltransferase